MISYGNEKYDYLVHLLRCSFNNTVPKKPSESFDWQGLLKLAKKHMVDDTIFSALEKIHNEIPKDILFEWTKIRFSNIIATDTQNRDREELSNALEKNEIKFLPLKGVVIKNYYPHNLNRQMADNDILIYQKDLDRCIDCLNKIGFSNTPVDEHYYDISFSRNKLAFFEMHFRFLKPSDDYYFYFENLLDKSVPDENKKYSSHLSDEDFYITITYHFYKHFKSSGCGIRFLADDFLFLKAKRNILDWNYINSQLEILNLVRFQKEMSELSLKIFEGKELNERENLLFNVIMNSGVFGYSKNNGSKTITFDDNGVYSAKKHFLRKLFPTVSYMVNHYPKLRNNKILLPFYYIHRIINKRKSEEITLRQYLKNIRTSK